MSRSLVRLTILSGMLGMSALTGVASPGVARGPQARVTELPTVSWTRQFGAPDGNTFGSAFAVDTAGNSFIGGWVDKALPGLTLSGAEDAYLRKYSPSGGVVWTKSFGKPDVSTRARAVATDGSGVAYLAGVTSYPAPAVAFIRKYAPSGGVLWTRELSEGSDASALAVDAHGNVFVGGNANAPFGDGTCTPECDLFIRKYSSAGDLLWSRQFGAEDSYWSAFIYSMVVNASGDIYVAGSIGAALPGQTFHGDQSDAFVRLYSSAGTERWTRQFGTSGNDSVQALAVDGQGNVYAGGGTGGALPGKTETGFRDSFLRKYSSTGDEQWTHQWGLAGTWGGVGDVVVHSGRLYIENGAFSMQAGPNIWILVYSEAGAELERHRLDDADWWEGDGPSGLGFDGVGGMYAGGTISGGSFPGETTPVGWHDAWVRKYGTGTPPPTWSTVTCEPGKKGGTVTIAAGSKVTCKFTPGSGATFAGWSATRFTPPSSTTAKKTFTAGSPGTGSIAGKYRDGTGRNTVTWGYKIKSVPVAANTTLSVAAGRPRYVPADDGATSAGRTVLVATLKDAAGNPVPNRKVILEKVTSTSMAGFRKLRRAASDGGEQTTLADGTAKFTVSAGLPGPVTYKLIDITGGGRLDLQKAQTIQFTRKVVVLVMGFTSYLNKRFCYFGLGESAKPESGDCEELLINPELAPKDPRGEPGTVYGRLTDLGFITDFHAGEPTVGTPGATILNMSWADGCGDVKAACVASIGASGGDVTWTPPDYDIGQGSITKLKSADRQLHIDDWAKGLTDSLAAYDKKLVSVRGYHASFYLVGHSMGGELVVRAIGKALGNKYLNNADRRGILPFVLAVDGALNWKGLWNGDFNKMFEMPKETRVNHCGFGVYTLPNADRERENADHVTWAHSFMGTTTIALTDANDWIVPYNPKQVAFPQALLIKPQKAGKGYGTRLIWGEGDDPGCGHRTLLHQQAPGSLWLDEAHTKPASDFPFGDLLEKYVGQASGG